MTQKEKIRKIKSVFGEPEHMNYWKKSISFRFRQHTITALNKASRMQDLGSKIDSTVQHLLDSGKTKRTAVRNVNSHFNNLFNEIKSDIGFDFNIKITVDNCFSRQCYKHTDLGWQLHLSIPKDPDCEKCIERRCNFCGV
jgi:hypothetical protein